MRQWDHLFADAYWDSLFTGCGWDDLFADEKKYALVEPHPVVVRTISRLRAAGVRAVLDLGCGAGRHLVLLGKEGFCAWGCDKSPRGLLLSRRKLAQSSGSGRLVAADFRALPFVDQCFDAVVSIHVLYHAYRVGMQKALDEARRVLKPGGLFVGTLISTRTWKYGRGRWVEDDTFVQLEGAEPGIAHHYSDERDVMDLLSGFTIENLAHDESRTMDNRIDCHWEVIAARR